MSPSDGYRTLPTEPAKVAFEAIHRHGLSVLPAFALSLPLHLGGTMYRFTLRYMTALGLGGYLLARWLRYSR